MAQSESDLIALTKLCAAFCENVDIEWSSSNLVSVFKVIDQLYYFMSTGLKECRLFAKSKTFTESQKWMLMLMAASINLDDDELDRILALTHHFRSEIKLITDQPKKTEMVH